jgi:hypothetical protein
MAIVFQRGRYIADLFADLTGFAPPSESMIYCIENETLYVFDGIDFIETGGGQVKKRILTYVLDGQGSVLSTQKTRYITFPFAGTIKKWSLSATGVSPTGTIDIWKIANGTALPTIANTIFVGAGLVKPFLSAGNANNDNVIAVGAGGTTNVAAYDIFGFNLDAITNALTMTLELEIQLT